MRAEPGTDAILGVLSFWEPDEGRLRETGSMGIRERFRWRREKPGVLLVEGPALFGVVGLDRQSRRAGRFSSASIGSSADGQQVVVTPTSRGVTFTAANGQITVTSHRASTSESYERLREWAPVNPYVRSPQGRAAAARQDRYQLPVDPDEVGWVPVPMAVDGIDIAFEVCDLSDGYWAAIGTIDDLIVTMDSRGVPVNAVALERLAEDLLTPSTPPDVGDRSEAIHAGLRARWDRLPFERVKGWADYWALRDVEVEHVRRLARQNNLSEAQHRDLESYWLDLIDDPIRDKLDRQHYRDIGSRRKSRFERHLRWNWTYQLWFNTIGPGARTWFGNRYTPIRHYTFRLWWRP